MEQIPKVRDVVVIRTTSTLRKETISKFGFFINIFEVMSIHTDGRYILGMYGEAYIICKQHNIKKVLFNIDDLWEQQSFEFD